MNVTVVSGKGDKVRTSELQLPENATVKDLKLAFQRVSKKSIHRQSFKLGTDKDAARLDDDSKTLASYNVKSGSSLQFKDLGPQIGYRTVFLLEYFGPILFVALYYTRPSLIYGSGADKQPYNWVATLGNILTPFFFCDRLNDYIIS